MMAAAAALNASRNGYNGHQQPLESKPQVTTIVQQPENQEIPPGNSAWISTIGVILILCVIVLIICTKIDKKDHNAEREDNSNGR